MPCARTHKQTLFLNSRSCYHGTLSFYAVYGRWVALLRFRGRCTFASPLDGEGVSICRSRLDCKTTLEL